MNPNRDNLKELFPYLSENAIDDLHEHEKILWDEAFKEGENSVDEESIRYEAYQEAEQTITNSPDCLPVLVLEKIGVDYAYDKFKDIPGIDRFAAFVELRDRYHQLMQP